MNIPKRRGSRHFGGGHDSPAKRGNAKVRVLATALDLRFRGVAACTKRCCCCPLMTADAISAINGHGATSKYASNYCRCLLDDPEASPPPLPPLCNTLDIGASKLQLPLVSVVSPTTHERSWTHASLYRSFSQQTYPNKELVILDTGPAPSAFFSTLNDNQVKYIHLACNLSGMSIDQAVDALETTLRNVDELMAANGKDYSAADPGPKDEAAKAKTANVNTPATADVATTSAASSSTASSDDEEHAYSTARHRWKDFDDGWFSAPVSSVERDERSASAKWREVWAPTRRTLKAAQKARERGDTSRSGAQLMREGLSLGAKRNWLAAAARGTIHANFDDDDVYLPSYLDRMVGALQDSDAELVKLGSFLEFNAATSAVRRYGTSSADDPALMARVEGVDKIYVNMRPTHGHLWGYGFSYVHTAELAAACPYPATNFGEDYAKVMAAAKLSQPSPSGKSPAILKPCLAFSDVLGDAVCCHVNHSANTSSVCNAYTVLPAKSQQPSSLFAASFDHLFASPCSALIDAARAHVISKGGAEWARSRSDMYSSSAFDESPLFSRPFGSRAEGNANGPWDSWTTPRGRMGNGVPHWGGFGGRGMGAGMFGAF